MLVFLTLTYPSRHKNFPEHPETDAWAGNLTPPSGESAHYAIGKIKIVSDWQIKKTSSSDRWLKCNVHFKITNQMTVVAISST